MVLSKQYSARSLMQGQFPRDMFELSSRKVPKPWSSFHDPGKAPARISRIVQTFGAILISAAGFGLRRPSRAFWLSQNLQQAVFVMTFSEVTPSVHRHARHVIGSWICSSSCNQSHSAILISWFKTDSNLSLWLSQRLLQEFIPATESSICNDSLAG